MTVYCPFSNSWLEFFVFLLFLPSHFPFEHKNDTVSFEMPLLFFVPEHYLLGPFVFGLLSKTKNCDFLERNSIHIFVNKHLQQVTERLPNPSLLQTLRRDCSQLQFTLAFKNEKSKNGKLICLSGFGIQNYWMVNNFCAQFWHIIFCVLPINSIVQYAYFLTINELNKTLLAYAHDS